MKILILLFLLVGFVLLFYRIAKLRFLRGFYMRTKYGVEAAARQRLLANRSNLQKLHEENSIWRRLEQELYYSGLHGKFPHLTVEKWLVLQVVGISAVFLVIPVFIGIKAAIISCLAVLLLEWFFLLVAKTIMLHRVDRNLVRFLDFLGNYSMTNGEVTAVLSQISRYLDEPLRGALEECCLEAQTTGDVSLALLSMAERIEHPKCKELIRNMEITIRYCADFQGLVQNSRRTLREYQQMAQERKGMLREAVINMLLLLLMATFSLLVVDKLIQASVWQLLFGSLPGQLALGLVFTVLVLFVRQAFRVLR